MKRFGCYVLCCCAVSLAGRNYGSFILSFGFPLLSPSLERLRSAELYLDVFVVFSLLFLPAGFETFPFQL
jgi:hypothetical protein